MTACIVNSSNVTTQAQTKQSGMEETETDLETGGDAEAVSVQTNIPADTLSADSLEKVPWKDRVITPQELEIPEDLNAWKAERNYIKAMIVGSLGDLLPIPEHTLMAILKCFFGLSRIRSW